MAVFLSPGIFPQELDLSALPSALGPLRPAFIGTAKKGPLNRPVLITTSQQYVDSFGEPFPESYLGYAVLAYLEEGNQCYVMRVGVEAEEGQVEGLADVAIDMSGAKGAGWGRVPVFTGIDYGRLDLREVTAAKPVTFHAPAVGSVEYTDADESDTNGATTATLNVTGTYTGAVDDSYLVVITAAPAVSSGSVVDGAEYDVTLNSTGEVIASGTLHDGDHNGTSQVISIENGLSMQVVVTDGVLDENDTFQFTVRPDNRKFSVSVNGDSATEFTMSATSYTTAATLVDAINALVSGEDYLAVQYTTDAGDVIPQFRTRTAGDRIQLMGTAGFANEVGTQQYAWDIPRSFLLGLTKGPYNINSGNNRVKMTVISSSETVSQELVIPSGTNQSVAVIANAIDIAGTVSSDTLWEAIVLTVPGETEHVAIIAAEDHMLDTLKMEATFSNLRTLRFANSLGIQPPYKRAYRGFTDNRVLLPASGITTPDNPLSCEDDISSDECASDAAYFANIVGWLVAPTPGTWANDVTLSLELFTEGVGDVSGRFKITVRNRSGVALDAVQDVSFDKTADRYIGNVVNPGTKYGGREGNKFLTWEERPAYLDNDPTTDDYTVRLPSQFNGKLYSGQANGIPVDPSLSSELDAAVIGNAAMASGLYAFENPETIDINLLATPGFTTGAVIGIALQVCERRGDVLYIVDPPFGLRTQQVVDWHNGMLLSDLSNSINSSYGALYWSWQKIFDQFSRQEIWVPPSGHVAAVFSRTARVAEQWSAPAGTRRGRLLTSRDVEYNPTSGERDLLYGSGNAVNAIVKFQQEGITIYGQRTLQRADSALNRVSVRMLLSYIKKNLVSLLRPFLFEPNDSILWKQVQATCEPFLGDIQSRRGLYAYRVIVDATNNTPERQDRNELHVTILLQPTKTVEFIALNIGLIQTGASFSAEEVLAAAGIAAAQVAT